MKNVSSRVMTAVALVSLMAFSPMARAGSYQLDQVSYYFSDPVSSDVYSTVTGPGSISSTASVTGSGTGQSNYALASGSLDLQAQGPWGGVEKTYVWQSGGNSYEPPGGYDYRYDLTFNGNSTVQSTGNCQASAYSSLVSPGQTVSNDWSYQSTSSGYYNTVTLNSFWYTLDSNLSANVSGEGTLSASLTQAVTFDVSLTNLPPEE